MTGNEYPYVQFGKPTKATYQFAEQVLKAQIEELYGSRELPNMYVPFPTLRCLCLLSFRYMVGGILVKILFVGIIANTFPNSFRQSRIRYEHYFIVLNEPLTWIKISLVPTQPNGLQSW